MAFWCVFCCRQATLKRTTRRKKAKGELSDGTFDAVTEDLVGELEVPPSPPKRRRWEFERSKLKLDPEPIGEGNFGKVYVAVVRVPMWLRPCG
jgi:hypothetical protein